MHSENQLAYSASSMALNDDEVEDARKYVPKEYHMSFLSAEDRVQKEQIESSLAAANFQNLILEMFAKDKSHTLHSDEIASSTLGLSSSANGVVVDISAQSFRT